MGTGERQPNFTTVIGLAAVFFFGQLLGWGLVWFWMKLTSVWWVWGGR